MLARLHFDPLPADGMDPSFPDAIVDARASTVQLGNGYLYLDAAADPARALLGYDDPAPAPAGAADVAALLESFAPGYRTLALAADRAAAVAAARGLAVDDAVVVDALDGEPALVSGAVVAVENRSLGRTGRWLASRSWGRPPEVVVIGEAIAAGAAFGAVLARADIAGARRTGLAADLDAATLARVAGVVAAAETAGLRQSAARLGDYLAERLAALAAVDNAILAVEGLPFGARLAFRSVSALRMKRKLCERGVLVGLDGDRLVILPPLVMRPAEIDVITGALRGALHDTPTWRPSACCAACAAIGTAD
jgi:4-aminobutyrate aminotransferase-like enzyme